MTALQQLIPHHAAAAGRHPELLLVAVTLIAGEFLWSRLRQIDTYDWKESAASLAVAAGRVVTRGLSALVLVPIFLWVYQHRIFTIPVDDVLTAVALFLFAEFLYYWFHRASHTVRWMWASHRVHHSSTRLNFSAAYRLGWTDLISGDWAFFLLPVWLGFSPTAVAATMGLNLFYQFFLHTVLVPKLGPLEWILNTPAHHRVHHAKNESCLDKNFGGTLIIYDRLFGTFLSPREGTLEYGLAGEAPSLNLLKIVFGEWIGIAKDIWRARSPAALWRAAFGRP